MNNKDFISDLSVRANLTQKEAQALSNALVKELAEALDEHTQLAIQGFGVFEVKKKLERIVVNPLTKQRKLIPPKLSLSFRPSPSLKGKVK